MKAREFFTRRALEDRDSENVPAAVMSFSLSANEVLPRRAEFLAWNEIWWFCIEHGIDRILSPLLVSNKVIKKRSSSCWEHFEGHTGVRHKNFAPSNLYFFFFFLFVEEHRLHKTRTAIFENKPRRSINFNSPRPLCHPPPHPSSCAAKQFPSLHFFLFLFLFYTHFRRLARFTIPFRIIFRFVRGSSIKQTPESY